MHRSDLKFFVNGVQIVTSADPEWTLAFYLREKLKLKGTKVACEEGACGSCTVVIGKIDQVSGKPWFVSANACVTPLYLVDDCCVMTVEGLGNVRKGVHPIQERLARGHGSQCGFCTPGFVMSMYALIRNNAQPSIDEIDAALRGNLCRCTGYRPILESFYTFSNGCGKENCCQKNPSGQGACAAATAEEDGQEKMLTDWSSMRPYDSTQEPIFPPELQLTNRSASDVIELTGERIRLLAPSTVPQLIALRKTHPNSHLVATGLMTGLMHRGTAKTTTDPIWLALYRIAEFRTVIINESRIEIGSSLSISDLHSTLVRANANNKFSSLIDLLDRYSSRQVRNIASWVGNVTSGNPTSDLTIALLALNATVRVIDIRTGEQRDVVVDEQFFSRVGGGRNCLRKDDVVASLSIALLSEQEHLFANKQGMRHGADSPIVGAAIYVKLHDDSKTIDKIRLAFGGIGSGPTVAVNTAAALADRILDEETLELGIATLSKEIALPENAPGGRAHYRSTLAVSFFFKFFDQLMRGSSFITSPIARGAPLEPLQLYSSQSQDQHASDACGRPLMCQYGDRHATGEADYVGDVDVANMGYMALVLSSRPHAKIVSIDASEALKMKGVIGYIDVKDIPSGGTNYPARDGNQFIPDDTPVFAEGIVESVGQTIAAIVAEDQRTARMAAQMVRIEYEDLPAIVTIEEAIKAESFLYKEPMNMSKGDIEKGLAESDIVVEGVVHMGGQEHFYLETQSTLASPGEGDEWTILCSSQQPAWVQAQAAYLLGIQKHKVVVKVKRLGGAFGGKATHAGRALFPAVLAAEKFRRPVRCVLSRKEDFLTTGRRHPMFAKYKIGMNKEGRLLATDCDIYHNGGFSIDYSVAVLSATVAHVDFVYDIPNMRVNGKACKTNLPSNTAFRGFGQPQAQMLIETIMAHVSETVGQPLEKIRELNHAGPGVKRLAGDEILNENMLRCWEECKLLSKFDERRITVDHFNSENKHMKRGIAMTSVRFGMGHGGVFEQGSALVNIYFDGSVSITIGGVEMGQGLNVKCLQVASRALSIPIEKINIMDMSTDKTPNATLTAGSQGSDVFGLAVQTACETLLKRLEPIIKQDPKGTWEQWIWKAYSERINLSIAGHAMPEREAAGLPSVGAFYYVSGAACTEVEVDCLTGDHRILQTYIVMDVGDSLNPAVDIGQIEGGFMQGYGLHTSEELLISPTGQLITDSIGKYKIPTADCVPEKFHVALLKNASTKGNVYSSKGIGEPPLFLGISAFFAIRDAIKAHHKQNGIAKDLLLLPSPLTPEVIRLACGDNLTGRFAS